ncbi:MAG: RHS repeat-associated core domain-containing protein, partial [Verrucomicrobiota bacterium]
APITETPVNQTPSPHTYTYDASGNNTGGAFQGNGRVQVWDEENRLKEVDRNGGMLAKFRYDDQGERRKKQTAAGDAWYVNQYFVLLPNNLPTKHIFAGETRIVSKTDAIYMQTPAISYYHPDHLGTTSYTTAANQDLLQHERYFAFGELWRPGAEQEECDLGRPDNLRREYTFTSKEWDVDTSLYYYGARYFDPHADVWQSPDPILKSYMSGGPNGGVFTPQNLGVYTYAYNNPIVLRDPDGHIVDTIADVGFTLFDVGKLIYDEARGHTENRATNILALGADAAAIFVPFVTGAGIAVRVGAHAGEAAHLLEVGTHTADAVKAGEHAVDAVKAGEHTAEIAKTGSEATHATADAAKATGTPAKEGIYEFTGQSGKKYVGQSGNIPKRLQQHTRSGKLPKGASVTTKEVQGGKTAREIAEQKRIDELGGIGNLENKVNPIGPNRQHLLKPSE